MNSLGSTLMTIEPEIEKISSDLPIDLDQENENDINDDL